MKKFTLDSFWDALGLAQSRFCISIFFLLSTFFSTTALADPDRCYYPEDPKLQKYCIDRNSAGHQRCISAGGYGADCAINFKTNIEFWGLKANIENKYHACREDHKNDIKEVANCSNEIVPNTPIAFD